MTQSVLWEGHRPQNKPAVANLGGEGGNHVTHSWDVGPVTSAAAAGVNPNDSSTSNFLGTYYLVVHTQGGISVYFLTWCL